MAINYLIEVAVPSDTSSTERGKVLERFARYFLETQNFRIQEEVRLTASEVDLLGIEKTTGERIFVECKAWRSTIPSEALQKLLGNVIFRNYSSGWLLSTYALSKDAKGFEDEWNQKLSEERRRLRIYPPERLVDRLISARAIKDPATLIYDKDEHQTSNDAHLILTHDGEYWALPVIDTSLGVHSSALLFNARTGARITSQVQLDRISNTDCSLKLPWISETNESQIVATKKLRNDLESIVRVPMADHWADYRPARPEDFVGRESVQASVFGFFDAVRNATTNTRLIAIKGPSGWGKSSSVLKIASRAANKRNKGKYFVFTVDSRAATTSRFPELAVISAVKSAASTGFIQSLPNLEFGSGSSLLSSSGIAEITTELKTQEKVICVFFDQFEELLYKTDLEDVFTEMRRLCAAVEEAQTNIIIGFSWKTDGVVPSEHNAYHMWHSLSDRRFEIELSPFTEQEVATAINRFSKELGHPIIPQLRRVLQDHCQGYPWLLKKLCIHILDLSTQGIEQLDILSRSINIQSLFKKDLENLSPPEIGCIKQIAQESPAEFFKITQNYGEEVLSRLVDKRLVIRSGTRLTIYWDIFRDYILTEKIPYIPVTYVPQANFSRYANALAFMVGKNELTYAQLGNHMHLSMGATDNLVRDLANLGHVDANRKETRIIPLFSSEQEAIDIAFQFWRSHEVVRKLGAMTDIALTDIQVEDVYRSANKRAELGERTVHTYVIRLLGWLKGLGIATRIGGAHVLRDIGQSSLRSLNDVYSRRQKSSDLFLGLAPPAKVVNAFKEIGTSTIRRSEIEAKHGRNTFHTLFQLGLIDIDGYPTSKISPASAESLVRAHARKTATVAIVTEIINEKGNITGLEVGEFLATKINAKWSEGSLRRYGNALRQWAEWTSSEAVAPSQISVAKNGQLF